MTDTRAHIICTYAGWTALSALRSGAPLKSRKDIYGALKAANFDQVFCGSQPICVEEFDSWHESATNDLIRRDQRLNVGWATKLLNVYLKTTSYVGELGRPGLRNVLHPPIDAGLWSGLSRHFANDECLARIRVVTRIKEITDYKTYGTIIDGCRRAASLVPCSLIELEQYWEGTAA